MVREGFLVSGGWEGAFAALLRQNQTLAYLEYAAVLVLACTLRSHLPRPQKPIIVTVMAVVQIDARKPEKKPCKRGGGYI